MTDIQVEIDRLNDLRRRALEKGLDQTPEDRELLRQLDRKLADAYGRRVAQQS